MELQPRKSRVSFPAEPIRIPNYANSSLVNLINGDFLIDFGFIDPYCVMSAESADQNQAVDAVDTEKEIEVLSVPLVRVVLNRQAAEQLIDQLKQVLDISEGK